MKDVLDSIFSSVEVFAYRCVNDDDYTMKEMHGAVELITGYAPDAILGNAQVSFVGLTFEEDKEKVFAEVDAAIEAGKTWDVAYRLVRPNGDLMPVRERGNAVFQDGELVYLEGLIVGAQAEVDLRDEMHNMLHMSQTKNDRVQQVVSQITRSLRQLNMLSINASVEAARSGEAGRGFAVVATEMKALANQNATWARAISDELRLNS